MTIKAIGSEWRKSDALLGVDGRIRTMFVGGAPFAREYFGSSEDFATGGDITGDTAYAGWTVTTVGIGTPIIAMGDVLGGQLQLIPHATEDEGIQMQTDGEIFLPAADNDIWFECEVQGNDITQVDWFMGLCTTDTTVIASNPADVIGFWTHDGDVNIDFEVSATAGAGAPVDTLVDLSNDTAVRLGFWVKGLTSVTPYINGVANTTATSTTVVNIPAVEMTMTFACLTGETAANRLDINWWRIVQLASA